MCVFVLCVCVCVCVCDPFRQPNGTLTYVCTCTYACTHSRLHAYTYAHMHARTHARTHAHMHPHTHARTHARSTHARTHTHTRTHVYTHVHICVGMRRASTCANTRCACLRSARMLRVRKHASLHMSCRRACRSFLLVFGFRLQSACTHVRPHECCPDTSVRMCAHACGHVCLCTIYI